MNKTLMIALGALALAACAPMNTSSNSMSSSDSMAMSGASMSGTSTTGGSMADASMTGTGTTSTSTAAVSVSVNTATPTTTNVTGATSGNYTFTKQPTAPAGVNPAGQLTLNVQGDAGGGGSVDTLATLSGLAPNTYYVAHYHVQGTASADPCTSKGAPIMASTIVGRSSDTGTLTLRKTIDQNVIKNATYFNVHTAADAQGTPADDGVACTPVH